MSGASQTPLAPTAGGADKIAVQKFSRRGNDSEGKNGRDFSQWLSDRTSSHEPRAQCARSDKAHSRDAPHSAANAPSLCEKTADGTEDALNEALAAALVSTNENFGAPSNPSEKILENNDPNTALQDPAQINFGTASPYLPGAQTVPISAAGVPLTTAAPNPSGDPPAADGAGLANRIAKVLNASKNDPALYGVQKPSAPQGPSFKISEKSGLQKTIAVGAQDGHAKNSDDFMDALFSRAVNGAAEAPITTAAGADQPVAAAALVDGVGAPVAKVLAVQTHFEPQTPSSAQQIGQQILEMMRDAAQPNASESGAQSASATNAQMFEQAVQQKSKAGEPVRQIVLELAPDHLGAVRLSLRYSSDRMHIDLAVERPRALEEVMSQSKDIRAILTQSGLAPEAVTITATPWNGQAFHQTGQSDAGSSPQYSSQRHQKRSDHGSGEGRSEALAGDNSGTPSSSRADYRRARGDIL